MKVPVYQAPELLVAKSGMIHLGPSTLFGVEDRTPLIQHIMAVKVTRKQEFCLLLAICQGSNASIASIFSA